MVRRVVIGNDSGTFRFRSSTAGHDAITGDPSYLSAYESMVPCVPKDYGSVDINGAINGADVTVNLSSTYTSQPFILIKATDGTLPGMETFCGWFVWGASSRITLSNRCNRLLTIKWWVFAELD